MIREDEFPKGYSVRQVLLEVLADSHWDSHERDTKVEIALGKVGFDDLRPVDPVRGGDGVEFFDEDPFDIKDDHSVRGTREPCELVTKFSAASGGDPQGQESSALK